MSLDTARLFSMPFVVHSHSKRESALICSRRNQHQLCHCPNRDQYFGHYDRCHFVPPATVSGSFGAAITFDSFLVPIIINSFITTVIFD
jgi:hypothetical protein